MCCVGVVVHVVVWLIVCVGVRDVWLTVCACVCCVCCVIVSLCECG